MTFISVHYFQTLMPCAFTMLENLCLNLRNTVHNNSRHNMVIVSMIVVFLQTRGLAGEDQTYKKRNS